MLPRGETHRVDITPYLDRIEHVLRFTHRKFSRSMDIELEDARSDIITTMLSSNYLYRFDPAIGRFHTFLYGFMANHYRRKYRHGKNPVNRPVSLDAVGTDDDESIRIELVAKPIEVEFEPRVDQILEEISTNERCTSAAVYTYDYPYGPANRVDLSGSFTREELIRALLQRGKYVGQDRLENIDNEAYVVIPRKLSVIFGLLSLTYRQTEMMSILMVSKTYISGQVAELSKLESLRSWNRSIYEEETFQEGEPR